jgi:hypothetical protein
MTAVSAAFTAPQKSDAFSYTSFHIAWANPSIRYSSTAGRFKQILGKCPIGSFLDKNTN